MPQHARVSLYEGGPGVNIDSAMQRFEDALKDLQQIDGHQGSTLLVDRNGGKAVTITYWDTEDHLNASVQAANELRQQAADAGGLSIRDVAHYEVALEERR
jgi:heme-degrading monooxygenase HmoA